MALFTLVIVAGYFAVSFVNREHYIHFWDSSTFPNMCETAKHILWQQGIGELLHRLDLSMGTPYNFLIVLLPALTLPVGGRALYILSIVEYYFVPWVFLTTYWVVSSAPLRNISKRSAALFIGACLALSPFVWQPILFGQPDIFCVFVAIVILLLHRKRAEQGESLRVFVMGLLLILLIALRRYFIFWSVGFMMLFGIEQLLLLKNEIVKVFKNCLFLVLGLEAGLFLAGDNFWAILQSPSSFSAYQAGQPFQYFLQTVFFSWFGVPVVFACMFFGYVLFRQKETQKQTIFLIGQGLLVTASFLCVQTMGAQHFYLVLPTIAFLLGTGVLLFADSLKNARRQYLFLGSVILFQAFSFLVAFWPNTLHDIPGLNAVWPMYYPPPQRSDIPEIEATCSDLRKIALPQTGIYAFSSSDFNSSILNNACNNLNFLETAEIDSRDGLSENFFQAEVLVIPEPLRLDLGEENQLSVKLPYDHFESDLHEYYLFVSSHQLEDNTTVSIYKRIQDIPSEKIEAIRAEYEARRASP